MYKWLFKTAQQSDIFRGRDKNHYHSFKKSNKIYIIC